MAIQRRAREVFDMHLPGEEVFLPLIAVGQSSTSPTADMLGCGVDRKRGLTVSSKLSPISSHQDIDALAAPTIGSPVSRTWKDSVGVILVKMPSAASSEFNSGESDHRYKKSRLLATSSEIGGDDAGMAYYSQEDEEGRGDEALSESDDAASDYFHVVPVKVQVLRQECCEEVRRCLELEQFLRNDLCRGRVDDEDAWEEDMTGRISPETDDMIYQCTEGDLSVLAAGGRPGTDDFVSPQINAFDALRYVEECQRERSKFESYTGI